MGTGELSGKPEEMLGGGGEDYLSIDWHPNLGGGRRGGKNTPCNFIQ